MPNKPITGTEADKLRRLLFDDFNIRQHKIINAGRSTDQSDYITRGEILDATGKIITLNGASLTNLNASNISSGTLNSLRLNIAKGNWVPTNAHVSLTVNSAKYWNLDVLVAFECSLTWPATADTNVATILGLPFTPSVQCGAIAGYINDTGNIFHTALITTIPSIRLLSTAGDMTNADMTGATVVLSGIFL